MKHRGSTTLMQTKVVLYVFSYVQFSNICARAVRQSLKANLQNEAAKREGFNIRATRWKDGKPEGSMYFCKTIL